MKIEEIKDFGTLKKSGYLSKGIKEELRQNLVEKIKKGEPAFEGLFTATTEKGLTVLSDALGWLEGIVKAAVPGGDHMIYVVELTDGRPGDKLEAEKPFVHIRKNGFGY